MNEITREQQQEAVKSVKEAYRSYEGTERACLENYVDVVLAACDITVEPPPILPDVMPGEWELVEEVPTEKSTWAIWAHGVRFAWGYETSGTSANGKVMAGSKKLAEAVVEKMRATGYKCNDALHGEKTKAVEEALAAMGVDMTEFGGE